MDVKAFPTVKRGVMHSMEAIKVAWTLASIAFKLAASGWTQAV